MKIEWNKVTGYSKVAAVIVGIAVFAVGFWLGFGYGRIQPPVGFVGPKNDVLNDVVFQCSSNKSIHAIFHVSKTVDVALSDGRAITLPLAMSASGARYANADESFVFWNKGTTAFIQEKGKMTYTNCAIQ